MKIYLAFSAVAIAFVLSGCASPARIDQMTVSASSMQTSSIDTKLKNSISVKDVTGGKETSPMWTSQVDSSDFQRALENSLRATGLLSPIGSNGPYQLTADLTSLDQPMVGFNMTVTATVRYSLIEKSSGKEIFSRSIPTPYTAKMGDAFVGSERLKLANEGAVRKNIEELMAELLRLKVQVSLK